MLWKPFFAPPRVPANPRPIHIKPLANGGRAMRRRDLFNAAAGALVASVLATLVFAPGARADGDSATHSYVSLGDSLAAGLGR